MPYFGAFAFPVLRASRRSDGQAVSPSPRSSLINAYTVPPPAT